MRMSCNGCRVLRKGCTETCSLRPCLHWLPTAQSQANATLFLAKFYGRAGLVNLINAGPQNLRPGIFKSLLYEACGRIVNPVYGSVGLMWSGKWHLCQAAVDAVLNGAPIMQVSLDSELTDPSLALNKLSCDIRHVSKEKDQKSFDDGLRKIKSRGRFKRSAPKPKVVKEEVYESASHESGLSLGGDGGGEGDAVSVETVEASLAKTDELADGSDLELELTLGFEPRPRKRANGCDGATCGMNLLKGLC
ncbi:hypothetical protein COLO4_11311 [Corchorus olitorius]|uniref:LOB domain-containing protein n=1 Tax=Corchorus olitorius TaxID=93759 RepID=A0A1R3K4Y2_9ROSI|nr:hypothetical protein COLO4_11311 [Corchorus olitorius]